MTPRKQHLIEEVFKAGNLDDEFRAAVRFSYLLLQKKYGSLKEEDLKGIWDQFGSPYYLSQMRQLYDSQFAEEDLEKILHFWLTPTGRKLVKGSFAESQKKFSRDWALNIEKLYQDQYAKKTQNK